MSRLEEAKRRYKKGDKVKSSVTGDIFIVDGGIYEDKYYIYCEDIEGDCRTLFCIRENEWSEIIKEYDFTQNNIKSGMKVQLRDGRWYLAVERDKQTVLVGEDSHDYLSTYTNFKCQFKDLDIVKVVKSTAYLELRFNRLSEGEVVWKEKEEEIPEFTMDELKDKLGMDFKIKSTK